MKDRGWGIQEASRHCHVDDKSLRAVLEGKAPRLDVFYRILDGLALEVEDIVVAPRTRPKKPKVVPISKGRARA